MPDLARPPGLLQIPGCDLFFDWSPGASRCCGAPSFAVVRYDPPKGDEATAIVCPRCRLTTLGQVRRLAILGTFDLLTGEYRPLPHPEPANVGDLLRFFPAMSPRPENAP